LDSISLWGEKKSLFLKHFFTFILLSFLVGWGEIGR
jgi:hypothetical protein